MHIENMALSQETFERLRDLIYDKTGIFYPDNKKYLLQNKLLGRIEETDFKTYEDYYLFLKNGVCTSDEYSHLFDSITIGETSFLRNLPQLTVFEKEILPLTIKMIRKENRKKIRIWSAACSTGEEPYTLAIILQENYALMSGMTSEIIGSDINNRVLNLAGKGIYRKNSLRKLPQKLIDKYFTKLSSDQFEINPRMKNIVNFKSLNLYNASLMNYMRGIDIIFCRNVLIYFSQEAKMRVINSLYNSLNLGGYLFIGHSEYLMNSPNKFKLENFNGITVYKKN